MSEEKQLPASWVETTLANVISPTRVGVPPSEHPDLPYIGMEHVEAETMRLLGTVPSGTMRSNALRFFPGDVLYGRLRPYLNKVYRPDFEGLCSAEFIVFRDSPDLDARYLQYFLNSWSFKNFASHLNEGDRPRVDWDQIKVYPFPLAPLAEQCRIVAAIEEQFTRLDAGVAALRSARVRLKQYRAAVLKAAVEGKLTEAWRAAHPETEPASALLARFLLGRRGCWEAGQRTRGKDPTKAGYVEPSEPETATLPGLSDGWCWATVEQLTARSEYGTSVKCDYTAQGVPVLRIPNIAAGEIDLTDLKYSTQALVLTEEDALRPGDLLVCRTNGSVSLIGKTALVRSEMKPHHTFASYLLRFRLVEADVLPRWTHLFLSSPQGRTFIERHAASSAGQHNISLTLLHSMVMPLPPMAEQEEIVAEVESRLSVLAALEACVEVALHRAERLRQSILAEAFAGRLVPQDQTNEPASELLERIRHERHASTLGTTLRRRGGASGSTQTGKQATLPLGSRGV